MGRITCDDSARQAQLKSGTHCNMCLSSGQAIGLAFSAETGCISFVAVIVLFIIIYVKYRRARRENPETHHRKLFRSHLDIFMMNLFISELLMSLGGMLDAKWAYEAQVFCGEYCSAQGMIQYLGETSVAIWTLAITICTGYSVVFRRAVNFRPIYSLVFVIIGWTFVFTFGFLAYTSHPHGDNDTASFITPTPFWCWINGRYKKERLGGEYFWLWLAGFGDLFVYIPLFLLLRGNIVLGDNGLKWYWRPELPQIEVRNGSNDSGFEEDQEDIRQNAFKMLWYPIAYTIVVLPLSVTRWLSFTNPKLTAVQRPENRPVATAALIFHAIFRLSGVLNVGLVLWTRPNVLLFGEQRSDDTNDAEARNPPPRSPMMEENGSEASLRQRRPAPLPRNETRSTGFGGPRVNSDRDDDEARRRSRGF